ncbi:pyroglutamyl-peptidase I [Limnochorda pilosa]|uniref:Pyrrolidone-carboxylate peptidase n=1 Tax=Limnochorda pilosa TaxID=1555112 RepID=A0A0K2SIN0_LIMPI|nr:pyroglutamyl-peptidase I [Limnochorda pilosa]BAS26882.1 peptidase C15 [Limnochorda pilosa]
MSTTVLVTGFEPFLTFPVNPSGQIAAALDGEALGTGRVVGRVLPVAYERAGEMVEALLDELRPDAVVALGLAAGRERICFERVAINCMDGEVDNQGVRHQDELIDPQGPAAYFTTLPIRAMEEQLRAEAIPAAISNTAGTYLCNYVMYRLLHHLSRTGRRIPAGFVHLPASHDLAVALERPVPSWPADDLKRATERSVEALLGWMATSSSTGPSSEPRNTPHGHALRWGRGRGYAHPH